MANPLRFAYLSSIMPISSIAQVLLRLFALNWVLMGLIQLASLAFLLKDSNLSFFNFGAPVILLAFGIIVWVFSPFLSRQFSRGSDASLTLQGVTLRQMYSTTFVGLGLYFSLNSFSRVFSWIHYFTVNQSIGPAFQNANPTFSYQLSEPAITLAVGVFIICTADTWAKRLSVKHSSDQIASADL